MESCKRNKIQYQEKPVTPWSARLDLDVYISICAIAHDSVWIVDEQLLRHVAASLDRYITLSRAHIAVEVMLARICSCNAC